MASTKVVEEESDKREITIEIREQDENVINHGVYTVQDGMVPEIQVSGFYGSQNYIVGERDSLLIFRLKGFDVTGDPLEVGAPETDEPEVPEEEAPVEPEVKAEQVPAKAK